MNISENEPVPSIGPINQIKEPDWTTLSFHETSYIPMIHQLPTTDDMTVDHVQDLQFFSVEFIGSG